MAKKNKYQDYGKETQAFMNAVEKHLTAKFGNIESQWDGLLQMLAEQYEIFIKCKERIKADGLMVTDRFNAPVKHPLLKVQTDSTIQITKLVQEFGISPKAMKGLNLNENNDDEFIEDLTNG